MTFAREQIHVWGGCETGGKGECGHRHVHDLLDQVEADAVHRKAVDLRAMASAYRGKSMKEMLGRVADMIDPYETVNDRLVRKMDGKPVTL